MMPMISISCNFLKILKCICLFKAMWQMLQLDKPEDFVISTGQVHSVREFVEAAFEEVRIDYKFVLNFR